MRAPQVCMCVMHLRPTGKEDEAGAWKGAKAMSESGEASRVPRGARISVPANYHFRAVNDQNFLRSLKLYEKDKLNDKSALRGQQGRGGETVHTQIQCTRTNAPFLLQ
jgi:hypothetical protein